MQLPVGGDGNLPPRAVPRAKARRYLCASFKNSVRPAHYLSILGAVALLALLWFGGNTIPPPKKGMMAEGRGGAASAQAGAASPMAPGPTIPPASTDSLLSAARRRLDAASSASLQTLEQQLATFSDSAAMAPVYDSMAGIWQRQKQPYAAAYSIGKSAHLAHSIKKLNFAGQFYREAASFEAAPSVQLWAAEGAVAAFDEALQLDPTNDTVKLALAGSYIEGTGETMKGVALLKDITARKPTDIAANLMLGKLSVQSGQIEKALQRFETVLQQEPENREALYFKAEAYRAKGDKDKAVAILNKLKKIVNNPDFSRDMDEYMKTF